MIAKNNVVKMSEILLNLIMHLLELEGENMSYELSTILRVSMSIEIKER